MKQRLGIAAALLPDPELLVLDEPTNGLDPAGIREVRALLRELADDGLTVVVSSHLLGEIQTICDHLVVIDAGQLRYQGAIDGLDLCPDAPKSIAVPEHAADLERLAGDLHRGGPPRRASIDGERARGGAARVGARAQPPGDAPRHHARRPVGQPRDARGRVLRHHRHRGAPDPRPRARRRR